MQTLTELDTQDAQRRERAYRYEEALGTKAAMTSTIPRLEVALAHHIEQVALIDQMVDQASKLDATIDASFRTVVATICGSTRANLLGILEHARAGEQRRIARVTVELDEARRALQQAESTLTDFGQ